MFDPPPVTVAGHDLRDVLATPLTICLPLSDLTSPDFCATAAWCPPPCEPKAEQK